MAWESGCLFHGGETRGHGARELFVKRVEIGDAPDGGFALGQRARLVKADVHELSGLLEVEAAFDEKTAARGRGKR